MSPADSAKLAAVSGGGAALVGIVLALVLVRLRRQRVGVQAAAVALGAVGAAGVGAIASAVVMHLSTSAVHGLLVALVAGASVGVAGSLALGVRLGDAAQDLGLAARRMGQGDLGQPIDLPASSDFAGLARELDDMQRALDAARTRERALDASRRELVAWVSHDLRTPLAGIRAMAEALEDGVVTDTATRDRYYGQLRVEADRLASLVDDLFELSRIQAGALRLHMVRASLGDLVSDAVASARPLAGVKRVRVEGRLATPGPMLDVSMTEFSRVLRNLLENAIRHTPSDGTVWVDAGVDGEHAFVSVADECGGIPEPDLDQVFDLAFRGSAARTPGDAGAGLGLAIAKGIVDAHHGAIVVANEGEGCRFTVQLPLIPASLT
ncbi:MAG: two-component sensor histidine kinase [Actinobacteria bacterium]|nr:two-component sensor histidine kinase [Actinomycetota bacterium]